MWLTSVHLLEADQCAMDEQVSFTCTDIGYLLLGQQYVRYLSVSSSSAETYGNSTNNKMFVLSVNIWMCDGTIVNQLDIMHDINAGHQLSGASIQYAQEN